MSGSNTEEEKASVTVFASDDREVNTTTKNEKIDEEEAKDDETKTNNVEEQSFEETEVSPLADDANDDDESEKEEDISTYYEHLRLILGLTCPIILAEIFQATLPVVDIAFVGSLPGTDDLAAAALASVWFNLWNATMLGFTTAIDTLLAQSYGASEYKSFAWWTGNSLLIVFMVTFPIAGLVSLCQPCMVLFGQDPDIAANAGQFAYRLIPGLFPLYAFKVLTKYLQTQNILVPGVIIGVVANLFNGLFNWLLIYHFEMGLNGAPWATTLTRLVEFLLMVAYMYYKRSTTLARTWPTFSWNQFRWTALTPFWKLGWSGALSIAAEAWSFEITTILAGLLGTVELDAHIITLTFGTFVYLSFPFAVGIATSIRVGRLIGEGCPTEAKRSLMVSFALTLGVQTILMAILWPCSDWLGDLFSSDEEVSALVADLIPLFCAFMIGDAIQANTGGAMRGLGLQKLVLFMNILGFWILAVPIGVLLTFVADLGVFGLWWGMTIGVYLSSCVGLFVLGRKVDWGYEAIKAQQMVSSSRDMLVGSR
jgi:MATE family multidrug resistance protein